jgi:hypothetical protein
MPIPGAQRKAIATPESRAGLARWRQERGG